MPTRSRPTIGRPVRPLSLPPAQPSNARAAQALEGVIQDRGFYMYVAGTALVVCSRFGLYDPSGLSGSSGSPNGDRGHGREGGAPGEAGGGRVPNGVTVDNYLTTLPMKKGLSSSAAVCVLVVRALCLVYGLELSVPQVCSTRLSRCA